MKKRLLYFRLHYSFVIFLTVAFLFGQGVLFLQYFFYLICHELVHAYFAKRRGYKIGRIRLMATGAVLEAESDEFTFNDEIIIAISAPLFNLAVALFIVALWWIKPEIYNYTQDLCVINLALFGFNILPIFPLDGGRVLLAFLSKKLERKTAVKISRAITFCFSVLLFGLFVASIFVAPNFSLGLMAVTLCLGAISEDKMAVYKRSLMLVRKKARVKKNGLEVRTLYVSSKLSEQQLFSLLSPRVYTIFILVDDDLGVCGRIEEAQVLAAIFKRGH